MQRTEFDKSRIDRLANRIRSGNGTNWRDGVREEWAAEAKDLQALEGLLDTNTIPGRVFETIRSHSTKREWLNTGVILATVRGYFEQAFFDKEGLEQMMGSINGFLRTENASHGIANLSEEGKEPAYGFRPFDGQYKHQIIPDNDAVQITPGKGRNTSSPAAPVKLDSSGRPQPERKAPRAPIMEAAVPHVPKVPVIETSVVREPASLDDATKKALAINDLTFYVTSFFAADKISHIPTNPLELMDLTVHEVKMDRQELTSAILERFIEMWLDAERLTPAQRFLFSERIDYGKEQHEERKQLPRFPNVHDDSEYRNQKDITTKIKNEMFKIASEEAKAHIKNPAVDTDVPFADVEESAKGRQVVVVFKAIHHMDPHVKALVSEKGWIKKSLPSEAKQQIDVIRENGTRDACKKLMKKYNLVDAVKILSALWEEESPEPTKGIVGTMTGLVDNVRKQALGHPSKLPADQEATDLIK